MAAKRFLTPFSLAALILAVYGVLHLAGLRENMSVLSGTFPEGEVHQTRAAFFAVLYLAFHLAATLVAPILILGAGIFWGMDRWVMRRN